VGRTPADPCGRGTHRTLALQLDDRDRADVDAVLARTRPLKGDCGDEYRYEGFP
jgi:hypothetical protein